MTSSETAFNDEELNKTLIARLRDLGDHASFEPHMHHIAADRIEELVKEKDQEYKNNIVRMAGQAKDFMEEISTLKARIEALSISNATLIAERDALFRRATLAEEWRDHDKTRAEAALASVKSKECFSDEKGVM